MTVAEESKRPRGRLRVYLGAAPGVGKTYSMLQEGRRRAARGKDVVIGLVETHERALTAEVCQGLEAVPRRAVRYRGAELTELDVDAVIARRPQVALVDELAHTNAPGSTHPKRWQDIDDLLDVGIDVITTVNIQHLESLNDVVESITGVKQAETVPDDVVRRADQIELVDMSPQALRRRMAHGNIYRPDRIDAALSNYFREGNLTALRELALLWTADRVDDALERYRSDHDIGDPWPTRERVVVGLTGGPEGASLLRRGARITSRASGGELLALHVSPSDGLVGGSPDGLARQRRMVEELGGTYHQVSGSDVAGAMLEFARAVNASQIVLGAPHRGRLAEFFSEGVGARVVRGSGDIDVLVVTHEGTSSGRRGRSPQMLSRVRRLVAWALVVVGLPLLTWVLTLWVDTDTLPVVLMIYLAATLAVALLGGMLPAVVAALVSATLANYLFVPPRQTLRIDAVSDVIAILLLLAVAIAAARVVDVSARRMREAARARTEADVLTTLTGTILQGEHAIMALLERLRESFHLDYVALRERQERHGRWRTVESIGTAPADADRLTEVPISGDLEMAVVGDGLSAEDMRVLAAVAVQADALMERDRLRRESQIARRERDRTATRTALLAAVSHDLRTPLAGIKAGVTSLLTNDDVLTSADRRELLATVATSTERLQSLVDNLLDMSRLDAGAVQPLLGDVWIPDLIAAAAKDVDPDRLRVTVPYDLPPALGDEGLLERVLANVLENAVRYSPADFPVEVSADVVADVVIIRVADRGAGVAPDQRERIFQAFQRLGDAPRSEGVGLGLAVARGFVEAQGGTIEADDTPSGGLTMLIRLPVGGQGSE
ncbi:MAG: two-component system, OmpR family, sensor histidine kinase KdpD [Actinomycetota bacterium]|nr:two-component system, OmpR family, sensor histidine kinase KdpD [Actinomycetota bacterium]